MSDELPSEVAKSPFSGSTTVSWADARAANQSNWDDRALIHEPVYGVEKFVDSRHLSTVIQSDLPILMQHTDGSISGLDVLHLQCHIGTDTVSLARAGANVTGLDFSSNSLEAARRVAATAAVDVTWVQSDVLEARSAVEGAYDVVYTSIGTICWLQDLTTWAQQIAALLKPGGVFFIRDGHPMLYALDETTNPLVVRYRYFPNGEAQTWDDDSTYVGDGRVEHARTYEFPHSLSEVLGALIAAGLVIERFDEGKTCPWQAVPLMSEIDEGTFAFPDELRDVIPCTFTVVARRTT